MAKRIVDVLEVIEIETQHRKLIAAPDQPQGLFELLAEQRPVRQIGQRVMARHVRDLLLSGLPFGDVLEGSDPPAAFHGLIDHAERTSVAPYRLGHGPAGFGVRHHRIEELFGIAVPFADRFHFAQDVNQQAALKRYAGPVDEST